MLSLILSVFIQQVIGSQRKIHYFLRLFLFWLIIFTTFRLVMILAHVATGDPTELFSSFYSLGAGFRLDLSTMAYLVIPSFALWSLYQFYPKSWIGKIHSIYHTTVIFLISLLCVANVKMYNVWESLVSFKVFDYLAHPGEVMAFISVTELLMLLLLLASVFLFSIFVYRKLITNFTFKSEKKILTTSFLVMIPFALIIGARGGLQLVPINESSAYFSDAPFYNHVSVNPTWYFIHSILETESTDNPFLFMEQEEATIRTQQLFSVKGDHNQKILDVDRPNIVFIILESWTADIIASLGGEKNVTPQFEKLRKEGFLFTQIYSPGSRTEHGLISILSGYPPPPHNSIITVPYKAEKLPHLNRTLGEYDYASSFYYGGELAFANMKSYLVNGRFEKMVDKVDFEEGQLNSKWGAHDEFVFEKQLKELADETHPFLSVLLTLSTHEPFDVPLETPFKGEDEPDQFRKAAYYTDHCLGKYFEAAKQQPWYENTLFILVADHGHRLPKKSNLNFPQSKRIPLLFFGGALQEEYRGKSCDVIGNQHDIAATLLSQLGIDYSLFGRSRDLLHPGAKSFAYYTTDYAMGWISSEQKFIYPFATKKPIVFGLNSTMLSDSIFLDAKAYLQSHFQEYLEY